MDRRRFLKSSVTGIAGISAASAVAPWRLLRADATSNRYLINIVGTGGWDSYWWHNSALLTPQLAANSTLMKSFTQRYAASDAVSYKSWTYGPGMKLFSMDLQDGLGSPTVGGLDDLLVVRGLGLEGQHKLSNQVQLQGTPSPYAASFSSLISVSLAQQQQVLDLHYMQIASAPSDLLTQVGMLSGLAVPVDLPDYAAWSALTGTSVLAQQASPVSQTVKYLATQAGASKLVQQQSKSAFQAFANYFGSVLNLDGSGRAGASDFIAMWDRYVHAVVTATANFPRLLTTDPSTGATLTAAQNINAQLAAQVAANAADPGVTSATNWQSSALRQLTFPYVMAEYLVRNNLSAVVDIPFGPNEVDAHWNNAGEFVILLQQMACYRSLIRGLKAAPNNLLGRTTIVLTNDFDRMPGLSNPDGTSTLASMGTGHGYSVSALLAGGGVATGRVIGGINTDPTGVYAPFSGGVGPFNPLPVDVSGNISQSSSAGLISSLSVFPTIMNLFGVTIPLQQITSGSAYTATKA